MAEAVAAAMNDRVHLLVQAGTGTGKSLGYLVPALLHDDRVVVATATLALQHQLVERDIPALVAAAPHVLSTTPTYSVLQGRGNYACLHRIRERAPDDPDATSGRTGRARRPTTCPTRRRRCATRPSTAPPAGSTPCRRTCPTRSSSSATPPAPSSRR